MASIYEKPPLFKLQKTWNEKTILPEVYKLTSPNPRNKNKAEIHKVSRLYGIKFTVDKMIPDFNKWADKVELDYATAFVEFENMLEGAGLEVCSQRTLPRTDGRLNMLVHGRITSK